MRAAERCRLRWQFPDLFQSAIRSEGFDKIVRDDWIEYRDTANTADFEASE